MKKLTTKKKIQQIRMFKKKLKKVEKRKNILKDYKHILEDKNDKKRNGKDDK